MTTKINSTNYPCVRILRLHFYSIAARRWAFSAKSTLLTLLMLVGFAASTFAANLVNDTWKDGTRTDPASPTYSENGTDSDADGNLESAWFLGGSGTLTVVTNPPSTDQLLVLTNTTASSASLTTYFTPEVSPVTLATIEDKLKVTWIFKASGINSSNTSQGVRMGIVNSPSASRIASDSSPASSTYAGYGMAMNFGTMFNHSSPFQLVERADPVTSSAFLSSSGSWTSLVNAGAKGQEGYLENTLYTFVFTATLKSGSALEVIATMTGGNIGGTGQLSVTNLDATPNSLTFDTFGLRPNGSAATAATNIFTSLFKVEYIPTIGCVPTAYNVTGGTTNCPGDSTTIGLSGSTSGYDYYLRRNGSYLAGPVSGTGSALDFGLQSTPGTYSVYASNTTSTCEGLMSSTAILANYASPVVTVNPSPVTAVNTIGSTRVFSIAATGSGLTYRWRKDASELSNGGNISGATTATLTLNNLTVGDSGSYDCVVSNSPCGASTISAAASLSVISGTGIWFRSINSGNWSDSLIWNQSTDGTTWVAAAAPPSNLDSNIVVRATHTVVVDTDVTADQLTVATNGTLSVQGGNLILSNGDGIDCNVAGTLQVDAGSGTITTTFATLQFTNGGVFNWNRAAAPAIPTAAWLNGSTCRISQVNTGSSSLVTGFSGQSYYDFVYDTTPSGQAASARCRLDLQGTTTEVRRDFTIKIPDVEGATATINNAPGSVLTVGRNVTFETGLTTNSNKILLHNAGSLAGFRFKIAGNFSATGFLDGFGGGSTTFFELNGNSSQTLSLPVRPNLSNRDVMNWLVNSGATMLLGNDLDGFNTFTNKGTLTFGSKRIIDGTTLVFDAACVVNASGTNMVVTNINNLVSGGTLNLGSLPAFSGGESFKLFAAAVSYTGSFGTLLPATPDGTHTWVITQLNTAGILAVSSAPPPTSITFTPIGTSKVVLNWPTGYGWILQSQTNNLSIGLLPTGWTDVPGATPPVTNDIVPGNPSVFYRLKY